MAERKQGKQKMDSPKISVIVPVYNSIDCLEKCVKSICAQTYSNLEILLIDDGSTDGSEKIVDEFDFNRIVYLGNIVKFDQ